MLSETDSMLGVTEGAILLEVIYLTTLLQLCSFEVVVCFLLLLGFWENRLSSSPFLFFFVFFLDICRVKVVDLAIDEVLLKQHP